MVRLKFPAASGILRNKYIAKKKELSNLYFQLCDIAEETIAA